MKCVGKDVSILKLSLAKEHSPKKTSTNKKVVYRREKSVTGVEGVAQPVAAKDTGHSVQRRGRRGISKWYQKAFYWCLSELMVILFGGNIANYGNYGN